MGFSHGRRKAAAKKVKAKDLKGREPDVKFAAGDRYRAVPHVDVIRAVADAAKASGNPCIVSNVSLYDGETEMVARINLAADTAASVPIRPVLWLASAHNGRQPVEALFGYEILADAGWIRLLITETTVLRKHTSRQDVGEFGTEAWATFMRGAVRASRETVEAWWDFANQDKMPDLRQLLLVGDLARVRYTLSKTTMSPFMKADPARLTEMIEGGVTGGCPKGTVASFLYRASRLFDLDEWPLRAVAYRRRVFLRAEGVPAMPSAVFDD